MPSCAFVYVALYIANWKLEGLIIAVGDRPLVKMRYLVLEEKIYPTQEFRLKKKPCWVKDVAMDNHVQTRFRFVSNLKQKAK